jgi:hypothetical protein
MTLAKGVEGQQQYSLDFVKAPGRHIRIILYLFIYTDTRCKFSPTTTTANDYYTNAPCPRGHCIDWFCAAA